MRVFNFDHVVAGVSILVFILSALAILLMFGFLRRLCWLDSPQPIARYAGPYDAQFLPNHQNRTQAAQESTSLAVVSQTGEGHSYRRSGFSPGSHLMPTRHIESLLNAFKAATL